MIFKIRGAPAIASLAALSVSQHLTRGLNASPSPDYLASREALKSHVDKILAYLFTSRPTAVNLGAATRRLTKVLDDAVAACVEPRDIATKLIAEGKAVADEDVGRNKEMAKWAGEWLLQRVEETGVDATGGVNVLTVCNTGSLATSVCTVLCSLDLPFFSFIHPTHRVQGYGTALGMITYLHETNKLHKAYFTQTAPYHQGSRYVPFHLP
jgi:methylthioribose-1-phosphate isomerase